MVYPYRITARVRTRTSVRLQRSGLEVISGASPLLTVEYVETDLSATSAIAPSARFGGTPTYQAVSSLGGSRAFDAPDYLLPSGSPPVSGEGSLTFNVAHGAQLEGSTFDNAEWTPAQITTWASRTVPVFALGTLQLGAEGWFPIVRDPDSGTSYGETRWVLGELVATPTELVTRGLTIPTDALCAPLNATQVNGLATRPTELDPLAAYVATDTARFRASDLFPLVSTSTVVEIGSLTLEEIETADALAVKINGTWQLLTAG